MVQWWNFPSRTLDSRPMPLNPATLQLKWSAGTSFRLKWSFHPAMWCPLRTRAALHVCIYPVTQIRQDPIHLRKQLENMGFLRAHRASESNSPWSQLPNIPERLNIWYQIPLKAYNFQWLLTLAAYRWKHGPFWSASLCFSTPLSYLLYTFFVGRGKIGTKSHSVSMCKVNMVLFFSAFLLSGGISCLFFSVRSSRVPFWLRWGNAEFSFNTSTTTWRLRFKRIYSLGL